MVTGHRVMPCPRCGAGQEHLHLQSRPPFAVRCGRCGAVGPVKPSAAEAVAGWNAETTGVKPPRKGADLCHGRQNAKS